jgi:hypothetical protein
VLNNKPLEKNNKILLLSPEAQFQEAPVKGKNKEEV